MMIRYQNQEEEGNKECLASTNDNDVDTERQTAFSLKNSLCLHGTCIVV